MNLLGLEVDAVLDPIMEEERILALADSRVPLMNTCDPVKCEPLCRCDG